MPRRNRPARRPVLPDPKFGNRSVSRFINVLMTRGKKSLARRLLYDAFDLIEERVNQNPIEIFEQALRNATPQLEVRPRRVGGATYQVPIEIRGERRFSLATRWLVQAARRRGEKTMVRRLAGEILDAYRHEGQAVRRREESHRMAEANKAFAHYRW
ncbi:MAG: 30S ribosomal protein S7 [Chloroflexi bacterium]|nr:30S ribosomal protein S7 [Chloroflexota bacterium]MDE2936297.1 30S ribosomal protein S7 [Chloroflexota bacterium]MXW28314.1 30S ribosomal protein S7 [Chloroflexota bacterium]MXX66644.1 30S ribosomal protein S7 [Chloroflexota bacterium]MXY00369.1 30S ribosomal protein S7 [Chloroflexota bacterium]